MWKSSVSVAALLCYAGALNAEDTFFDTHLPGIVENIARGAEQGMLWEPRSKNLQDGR